MRHVRLALVLLAATLAQACATCPSESMATVPDACPQPDEPAYVDPCAVGAPYVTEPYRDGRGAIFPAGGTVRAGNTGEHELRFEPGQTLTDVRVRIVPRYHDDVYGMILPTIEVRQRTEIGDGDVVTGEDPYQARAAIDDDTTVAADYSRPHDVIARPGWQTDRGTSYFVTVGGEAGDLARDYEICGTSVTLLP